MDNQNYKCSNAKIDEKIVGRCVLVDSGNPGHLVVEDSLVKVENSHAVPVVAS